jgi:predicted RNase H-like HicB family nuclease/predicted RNA binding protein YcfA (HicA-like mRNA interferase family)
MRYKIALHHTDEGFSVSVPGLPGCWSQGATEEEAIQNIEDAIREYLAARDELLEGAVVREVEVAWQPVPRIAGVNHQDAVRALQKVGFRVVRQGKHIVMSDGVRILTIPRHNPVNAFTMGGIVRDAGLTEEEFRGLL